MLPDGSRKLKLEECPPDSYNRDDSSTMAFRPYPAQCLVTLAEAGLVPFPAASSRRSGSIEAEDLNVYRICRSVNQAFLDSLPRMGPFTAKQAQALMTTFLTTRVGYEGEDLQRRLEHATVSPSPGRYRFATRTETPTFRAPPQVAYHGSHPETLHALIALGSLVPSTETEPLPGARYFEGRQGVYLHASERRAKAEGYSAHVRLGKPHVYMAVLLETLYDPSQSLKKGKSTDQLIIDFRGVQIKAVHIKLATKETLALGDSVRDWNPELEVDPAEMLRPADLCGIRVPEGCWEAGGKEPFRARTIPPTYCRARRSCSPSSRNSSSEHRTREWSCSLSLSANAESTSASDSWLGTPGSLGPYRPESTDPKSSFSEEVSKALTSSLRHGNGPKIYIAPSGFADLSHILALPRLKKLRTTAADVLEIVRNSPKERFQLKKEDQTILLRAAQGHSRQDLDERQAYDALQAHEVPTLLAHGTYWRHYSSIFQHGLQPGGKSSQRRHTHLIDADIPATEIRSGFRESVEMILFIAGREAAEAGLQFFRSTNGVFLTAQVISPIYFRGTRDAATGTEYDNKGRVCG